MKKKIQIILDILCTGIVVLMATISALYIRGIKPFIIISGSMIPKIPIGSICFIDNKYSYEEIQVNDIIMYQVPKQNVIHRVVEKNENGYKTKGDANENVDRAVITPDIYLGKYLFSIPLIGYLVVRVQTPVSKAIFITILISLYVVDYLMHYAKKQRFNINE